MMTNKKKKMMILTAMGSGNNETKINNHENEIHFSLTMKLKFQRKSQSFLKTNLIMNKRKCRIKTFEVLPRF